MPSYYPVYLNLRDRRCLVIGGGAEAERKAQGLLDCGANVTVVSPKVTPALHDLAARKLIDWEPRAYRHGDLEGAFLAISDNVNSKVYQEVAAEAEQRGILLNVTDVTALCNFIAPAVVRRGEVTFAISTGGASPALARRLREELEKDPVLRWADMAAMISDVRLELRGQSVYPDPERWQECMDQEMLRLFHTGSQALARARLLRMLQEPATTTPSAV